MIQVEFKAIDRLTFAEIGAWADLEDASVEGNAFMSPRFVLPVLRYLRPDAAARILFARVGSEWVSAIPVEARPPGHRVPFLHLRPLWCEHSYLSGPLLREDGGLQGLTAMFDWLRARRRLWGALELLQRPSDGPVAELLDHAQQATGATWTEYAAWDRAALTPSAVVEPTEVWSRNQRKKLRRSLTRFGDIGDVEFRTIWNESGREPSVETFLELESMGWKGTEMSAIASNANRERFFRELLDEFGSAGASFMTQLVVGGRVVASSVNLVSRGEGYGFKLGWDLEFADLSPGTTHEFEYVLSAREQFSALSRIDATSDPGSFVDAIWPGRRRVSSGAFVFGRGARAAVEGLRWARAKRRSLAARQ